MMRLELWYFDGCPHWTTAAERLDVVAARHGLTVELREITTEEDALRFGFRGSPTVLVDGRDPFGSGEAPTGLACRIYQTPAGPAGSPTVEQLEAVVSQ